MSKTLTPEILKSLKFKMHMHLNGGSEWSAMLNVNEEWGLSYTKTTSGSPDYKIQDRILSMKGDPEVSLDLMQDDPDFQDFCDRYNQRREVMKVGEETNQGPPLDGSALNRATTITDEDLDQLMKYHPWDEEKVARGNIVREALGLAIKAIVLNVPPCADRTVAIRKIREARMDANSAITHDGAF